MSSPQVATRRRAPGPWPTLGDEVRSGGVVFDEAFIRRAAHRHGPGPIAWLSSRYAYAAARLRFVRGIHFRQRRNADACAAYEAMDAADFTAINARQAWSNWRTIPRNLSGRLPARPLRVLDLCCGMGDSTAVLAYYCPPGSRILGLELNPRFVALARQRDFRDRFSAPAAVAFRAQSVLDPFRGVDGSVLADNTIELVNASGAIGCHFDIAATDRVARECSRVLIVGGYALMDVGGEGTSADDLLDLFSQRGFELRGRARSCPFNRLQQLCLLKTGGVP